jgi:hypothetical protein
MTAFTRYTEAKAAGNAVFDSKLLGEPSVQDSLQALREATGEERISR